MLSNYYSFGYVTEKRNEQEKDEVKLYKPGRQYFHKNPQIIKKKTDIKNVIENINPEKIIHKLSKRFKDSKTRLIGIYSMAIKVIRLDFVIDYSRVKIPQYIIDSHLLML